MNNLRQQLLDTGCFVDNEFLSKYIQLVSDNRDTCKQKYSTQRHHIIPNAYYKHILHSAQNDSKENIVTLMYKDHILAHYYLAQCTTGKLQYYSMYGAYVLLNMKEYNNEGDLILELPNYQSLYEEFMKTYSEEQSIMKKGVKKGNGHSGKKYMNNGTHCVCISSDQFDTYISQGYTFGRLTSEEARKRIRQGQLGSARPTLRGVPKSIEHKNKLADANIGRVYLVSPEGDERSFHRNDPQIHQLLVDGWIEGRKPMSEEAIQNMRAALKGRVSPRKGYKCNEEERQKLATICLGRVWVHNDECSRMIYPDELEEYFSRGYVRGRVVNKNPKG